MVGNHGTNRTACQRWVNHGTNQNTLPAVAEPRNKPKHLALLPQLHDGDSIFFPCANEKELLFQHDVYAFKPPLSSDSSEEDTDMSVVSPGQGSRA